MRLTDLETAGLKRCRNCKGKMLRSTLQSDLKKHIGHFISPAADVHFWEFVRIKLGWL